ncbi:hydrogenase iron-sulfur subunit [Chloroflexota bacterium]
MYPKVVVFACNWDGWSCIDTAANSGLHYPVSLKVLRVSCLSRVHSGLILKAFELGADGVILLGCEEGNCHFGIDRQSTLNEYDRAGSIMDMLGIPRSNLSLIRLPAFAGQQFVTEAMQFLEGIRRLHSVKNPIMTGAT